MTINIGTFKTVVKFIADVGITAICGAAIGTLPIKMKSNIFGRAAVAVGGLVLAGIVSSASDKYVDTMVDDVAKTITDALDSIKNAQTEINASIEAEVEV